MFQCVLGNCDGLAPRRSNRESGLEESRAGTRHTQCDFETSGIGHDIKFFLSQLVFAHASPLNHPTSHFIVRRWNLDVSDARPWLLGRGLTLFQLQPTLPYFFSLRFDEQRRQDHHGQSWRSEQRIVQSFRLKCPTCAWFATVFDLLPHVGLQYEPRTRRISTLATAETRDLHFQNCSLCYERLSLMKRIRMCHHEDHHPSHVRRARASIRKLVRLPSTARTA